MARGDKFVFEVARKIVLSAPGNGIGDIIVSAGCAAGLPEESRTVVRELYGTAVAAVEEEKRHYLGSVLANHPGTVLRCSVALIEAFLGMLKRLSRIAHATPGISARRDGARSSQR